MYQPTQLKKTTTPSVKNIVTFFLLLAGLAGTANAEIRPPVCPGPDCRKVITFYNNTNHPVFVVIQAGIQNPDPWLQALFNDNTRSYAETHYSRAYIDPVNGIPPGSHVSVTVPWYSQLRNDTDTYVDWYNGGRVVIFDSKQALDAAHAADLQHPLSTIANSPIVTCDTCEQPLRIYKDSVAFKETIPLQLVEYTFADVLTPPGRTPFIEGLNINYNISYLDQIYLPVALAPCRTEPCNGTDSRAIGYLGTIQKLEDFRASLRTFSTMEGWPRYTCRPPDQCLDDASRPRLPGAYNVFVDRVNVIEKHQPSRFTPPGRSVTNMIAQWKTCIDGDRIKCPQYLLYQKLNTFFTNNYRAYNNKMVTARDCPKIKDPLYYPVPKTLTPLNIMPYVYGWAAFNSGCLASFNALAKTPGPPTFNEVLYDYIHDLQYNYLDPVVEKNPQQRFNPFVDLVHGQLKANSYAFSVDDNAAYLNAPGQGLIITIGGKTGLPNANPIKPKANFKFDFQVNLGDSIAAHVPRWKQFGVCQDFADRDFPFPVNNVDAPIIIVDSVANQISQGKPCTITVTDDLARKYQFQVRMRVPWPPWNGQGFDPQVVRCVNRGDGWCEDRLGNKFINETAKKRPAEFILFARAPLPR
jgi:hypothetical protein